MLSSFTVKGSSRALFHAVVVMGAGLTACAPSADVGGPKDRGDAAGDRASIAGGAEDRRDRDAAAVAGDAKGEGAAAAAAKGEGEAAAVPGDAKVGDATGAADAGDAEGEAADVGDPKDRSKPQRRARAKKGACPEGSEMPVPPCYYIL